jgi:hypothetical protein
VALIATGVASTGEDLGVRTFSFIVTSHRNKVSFLCYLVAHNLPLFFAVVGSSLRVAAVVTSTLISSIETIVGTVSGKVIIGTTAFRVS